MKERIKEYDLARVLAIMFMLLVHLMYAIYDYSNYKVLWTIDFLGTPFAAPVFMFILGANIVHSKKTPKELFRRGLKLFIFSIVFNIICHALPFYIISSIINTTSYLTSSLHWIGACDILTFSGLAFMLMALLKKIKINNFTLGFIALSLSGLNTIISSNIQISFENYPLISTISGLFYSSSITGYFSLFGWFLFPVAGKIYMDKYIENKNSKSFHIICLISGLIIYISMLLIQKNLLNNYALIHLEDEYSYYKMNIYDGIMYIGFLLAWINILYYIVKIIPNVIQKRIEEISRNLTIIYVVQWFLINYGFVLLFKDYLRVNTRGLFISFTFLILFTYIIVVMYKKIKKYLNS